MPASTTNDFFERHLPHRLDVLRGFRNRSGSESPQVHCAMKDGAMVTCRVLWSLLGVVIEARREHMPHAPTVEPQFKSFEGTLPAGVAVRRFSKKDFKALGPSAQDIKLVLVAANKCVAHLDDRPDHGVTEDILDRVIDITLAEINQMFTRTAERSIEQGRQ